MCRVANCCGCASTERGSLVIAIAAIILGVLGVLGNVSAAGWVGLGGGVLELICGIILLIGVKTRR